MRFARTMAALFSTLLFSPGWAEGKAYELTLMQHPTLSPGGCAMDVSDAGVTVGWAYRQTGGFRAYKWAASGTATLLDTYSSVAMGINDLGQIAGYSYLSSAATAVVYDGTSRQVVYGSTAQAFAHDVNNVGDVVGRIGIPTGTQHAFARLGGQLLTVPQFSMFYSEAYDVNNSESFVGRLWTHDGDQQAFIYRDGQLNVISSLRALYAINDKGQAAGVGVDGKLYLYEGGQLSSLATLPTYDTAARSDNGMHMNEAGQITVFLTTSAGSIARLWDGSQLLDPNSLITPSPGCTVTKLKGINEAGWIAGAAVYSDGIEKAILLTPVPEPTIVATTALFCFALLRRHRQHAPEQR